MMKSLSGFVVRTSVLSLAFTAPVAFGDDVKDLRFFAKGEQEYRLIFRSSDNEALDPNAYILNRVEDPKDNPVNRSKYSKGAGSGSVDAWSGSLSSAYSDRIELDGFIQSSVAKAMLPFATTLKSVMGNDAASNPLGNNNDMKAALVKSILSVRKGLSDAWKKSAAVLPEDSQPLEKEILFIPLGRNEKLSTSELFYQSRKLSVSPVAFNLLRRGNLSTMEKVMRFNLRGAIQQAADNWNGKAPVTFVGARTFARMSKNQLRIHMQGLVVLHPRTIKGLGIKDTQISLDDLVIPGKIDVGGPNEFDHIPVALVEIYQQLDGQEIKSGKTNTPPLLEFKFGEFDTYTTATSEFTVSAKSTDKKVELTAPMFTIVSDRDGETKKLRRKLVPRLEGYVNQLWKFGPKIANNVKVDLNLLNVPVNLETTNIPMIDLAVSAGIKLGSHRLMIGAFEIGSVDEQFTKGVNDAVNAQIATQIKAAEAKGVKAGEDQLGVSNLGGIIPVNADELIKLIINYRS